IKKAMQISEDVQETEDDDDEMQSESLLDDISSELYRRLRACGDNYPFQFDKRGYNFFMKEDCRLEIKWLYIYFLLATRHKMGADRIIDKIDGSLLFESICKDILQQYLGENSDGYVFGTENRSYGFHEKLNELAAKFGEGIIKEKAELTYEPQDDKLDIAAWISFLDGQP